MQNPCVESISCQVSCMHLEHADYILHIKKKTTPQKHGSHVILSESSYCKNEVQMPLTGFKQKFCCIL